MDPQARQRLFDSLQREYCPTIDSSLIAALLAEIDSDAVGNEITPTQSQIDYLRTTLGALSLQAEESQLSELSDLQLTSQPDETISSWTTPENTYDHNGGSASSSASSTHPFSSPLGFLQAALPEIPTARLNKALQDAERDGIEMWDIIAGILTEESIREMEERGLDGLDEEDGRSSMTFVDNDWETVSAKRRSADVAKRKPPPRPKKILLADVRQRHQLVQPKPRKKNGLDNRHPPSSVVADPWTQISSLSEHVASLLPPHPPSVFQSFFHSPKYTTSYEALRSALTSLCQDSDQDAGDHTTVTFNLLDLVMPQYEVSDDLYRARVAADVELAVAVTRGAGDEALQLVDLLRELDSNAELGVHHQPAPAPAWKSAVNSPTTKTKSTLSGPPDIPPPPPLRARGRLPPGQSHGSTKNKPSPYQWQAVPQKKVAPHGPHPLSAHIPAYVRDVNGMRTARAYGARETKTGGVGVEAEASEFQRRMNETMRKRNEALREATRMWQKGNAKTRGGEVAYYFAERARELQEVARQEGLNAARAMVHAKRVTSENSDTVDLHGTTVAEAITIVKEILNDEGSSISQAKPMKIITGRGTHSVNQIGVLKPAIKKALVEDGWVVSSWDGGLTVRQRQK